MTQHCDFFAIPRTFSVPCCVALRQAMAKGTTASPDAAVYLLSPDYNAPVSGRCWAGTEAMSLRIGHVGLEPITGFEKDGIAPSFSKVRYLRLGLEFMGLT